MKISWLSVCVLLASSLWAGAATPPNAAYQQSDEEAYAAFKKEFELAQKINAKPKMAQLVKANQREAIWWITDTCIEIASQSSDVLETRIADLRMAWQESYETNFVDELYKYYSLLRGPTRQQWFELSREYQKVTERAAQASDRGGHELAARDFKVLAERFEELGDQYSAARCWLGHAVHQDEGLRKDEADLYQACAGYERATELYKKIGFKGQELYDAQSRFETLERSGFADEKPADSGPVGEPPPAGPAEPGAAPAAAVPAAAAATVALAFEPFPDWQAIERPYYGLDGMYPAWPRIVLGGVESTQPIASLPGPKLIRAEPVKVIVDTNGDSQADAEVPLTGRIELVEFEIERGGARRKLGMLTTIGLEKDTFQHVEINLAPADEYVNIFYLPASSATASVNGVALRIFDDNFNGSFGDAPLFWKHQGVSSQASQPEMDSVAIGESTRAQPWSQYQQIGGVWYELSFLDESGQLSAKPVTFKLGELALEYSGPDLAWLVVRGLDGLENSYFDLAATGKQGLQVPVGRYELFYGEVRQGKGREELKTLILPSSPPTVYTVSEGQTTTLQLGKPFGFDFGFKTQDGQVLVEGKSVVIVGRAGERYERAWNCRPQPDVSWRKVGTKRGSKPESMTLVDSQGEIGEVGWDYFFFPKDLALELKGLVEGETIEVQLSEKKNKLFGKIESEWKE